MRKLWLLTLVLGIVCGTSLWLMAQGPAQGPATVVTLDAATAAKFAPMVVQRKTLQEQQQQWLTAWHAQVVIALATAAGGPYDYVKFTVDPTGTKIVASNPGGPQR